MNTQPEDVQLVPVESIKVPGDVQRENNNRVDDDVLAKSIRQSGIQQPLILIRDGDGYRLVKGTRRLKIAKAVGIPKVPAVVATVPAGLTLPQFSRRLRFVLHEHQQDLLPSQRAELIVKLKSMMRLTSRKVAAFLGVDQDSITNWLAIRNYIPEVTSAMDSGALTQKCARVFDGLSELGQKTLWKKHSKEIIESPGGTIHKEMRAKYSPKDYPSYYNDAKKMEKRLARQQGNRRSKPRAVYTEAEKKDMLRDVEFQTAELAALKAERKELKEEIEAATPIVAAIIRNKKLKETVPQSMIAELERFAEVYV